MVGSRDHPNISTSAAVTSCGSDQSANSPGLLPLLSSCSHNISVTQNLISVNGKREDSSFYSNPSRAYTRPMQGNFDSSMIMDPQQPQNIKPDSVACSGVYYPFGLPSLQISSNINSSVPKGSGTSLHSPVTGIDPIEDGGMYRSKLLKTEMGYQPMPMGNNFRSHPFQEANPSFNMRSGQQFEGRETLMQCGPPRHASLSDSKVVQNDFLQQQAAQTRLMRCNPMLTVQLQQHGIIPQHVQAHIIRQQLLQQQQQALRLQRSHFLQQQQQLQKIQFHVSQLNKQSEHSRAGACTQILMQYLHQQRMRPHNNNVQFWRELVLRYFSPHSRRRWCLSQCCSQSNGHHSNEVLPQAFWNCNICGSPGLGFEALAEILPRVCKTRFDSGELDELLFLDHPNEVRLESGWLVLEYAKAIQEVVYEHVRVVWEGHLRLTFSTEMKIVSWDFCAKSHEEFVLRRFVAPQVTQLATASCKLQSALSQNNGTGLSSEDLQTNCHMFASSAHQLTRSLESPYVNVLGFTKRFVRCMQIAEAVNCMKPLMDFSYDNDLGPIESLSKYHSLASEISKHANQTGSFNSTLGVLHWKHPTVEALQSKMGSQDNVQEGNQNTTETSNIDYLDLEAGDQDSNLSAAVSKHPLQSHQTSDSPQSSVFDDQSILGAANLAVDVFNSLKTSANESSHIDNSLLVLSPTDSSNNIHSSESVNIDFLHHIEENGKPQCDMSLNTKFQGVGFEDAWSCDPLFWDGF